MSNLQIDPEKSSSISCESSGEDDSADQSNSDTSEKVSEKVENVQNVQSVQIVNTKTKIKKPKTRCQFFRCANLLKCIQCGCINENSILGAIIYYLKITFTFVYLIATVYVVEFMIYWYGTGVDQLKYPYWLSVSAILFTNICISIEVILAFRKKYWKVPYWDRELPADTKYPTHLASMFAAYLPNEIDTLEGPIRAMIHQQLPPETYLTVIVAHNGGSQKHLNQLYRLITTIRKELPDKVTLNELNVETSRSKAANVNGCVDYIKKFKHVPEMIAIFDADHRPNHDNLHRAMKTMLIRKADVIQGRNCITSGFEMIAIEFDIMYCVFHAGGEGFRRWAIFGGSNAIWKTEVLDKIRMDPTLLTEDINSSLCALRNHYKIVYDVNVISNEEAPPTVMDLIKQRMRWNSGFFELLWIHSLPLIFGPGFKWTEKQKREKVVVKDCKTVSTKTNEKSGDGLESVVSIEINDECEDIDVLSCRSVFKSLQRRIGMFLLFPWREMYYYVASQALPAGIIGLAKCYTGACINPGLMAMTGALLLISPINALIAYIMGRGHRHPNLKGWHYVIYGLFSMFYELFKFHLAILCHARNMVGLKKWRVTKRKGAARSTTEAVGITDGYEDPPEKMEPDIAEIDFIDTEFIDESNQKIPDGDKFKENQIVIIGE